MVTCIENTIRVEKQKVNPVLIFWLQLAIGYSYSLKAQLTKVLRKSYNLQYTQTRSAYIYTAKL